MRNLRMREQNPKTGEKEDNYRETNKTCSTEQTDPNL